MRRIRKILFPTRFEPLSYSCLGWVLPLARAGAEEIVFLYVIDRDEVGFVPYGGFDRKLADELREKAKLHFEDWSRIVEERGLRWRAIEEVGNPEAKILEVAGREGVDLIVTGRQHHHPLDAVYLGGTAMEILRESRVPVLVCKAGEAGEGCPIDSSPFDHVLLATDFSAESRAALDFLLGLRAVVGCVSVVHVFEELEELEGEAVASREAELRTGLEGVCAELRTAGLECDSPLVAGDVEAEVLRIAADGRCTGIIMGTMGKHGLRELFEGSDSHRVTEGSPIPVVLVPLPKD
ncbi:MAG: universal stress protein [Deltaproteobacteria bacterium]|nr:universal stress protein [Deltaproteobacteria bacterium]